MAPLDESPSLGAFRTTNWSLIEDARGPRSSGRRVALGEFFQRYLPALRAHLVLGKRLSRDQADDVLQAFFTAKIVSGNLLAGANPERGRLRSLLLKSLDRYLVSTVYRRRAEPDSFPDATDFEIDAPVDPFEVAWARQLLETTLREMRAECDAVDKQAIWGVFEARLLRPILVDAEPIDYRTLVERFELRSAEQAGNLLVTAKRMFCRRFASVAETFADDVESSEEVLSQVMRILSQARTLDWQAVADQLSLEASAEQAPSLSDTKPEMVASVLQQIPDARQGWPEVDCGPLLDHLLRGSASEWIGEQGAELTLGSVLTDPAPNIAHLEAIKTRSRQCLASDEPALPPDVYKAIYFASVAVGLVRCGKRITSIDTAVLRFGFESVATANWSPPVLRVVTRQAMEAIS